MYYSQRMLRICDFNPSLCSFLVTMGGDLQPGCLADRLLTGLGKVRLHHYICLKGHLSGSLEKA